MAQTWSFQTYPLALLISLGLGRWFLRRWQARTRYPYPPGPKPKPLIGNLLDVPSSRSWLEYEEWGLKYNSDILHVQLFNTHLVILNSVAATNDLLNKQSNVTSNRPPIPMLTLCGWEFNSALLQYSDPQWRQHRALYRKAFGKDECIAYQPLQKRKVQDFLINLLHTPGDFSQHTRTLAAAVLIQILYGHDVAPTNDRIVELAELAVKTGSRVMLPGATVVNSFPALRHLPRWLPGLQFHKMADECRKAVHELMNVPFDFVRKEMKSPDGSPSALAAFIDEYERQGILTENLELLKGFAAATYAAGADSFVAVVGTFFYAMALHPSVQAKAQEEIERVVGKGRLPTFSDRPSLPYVEAVYREIMRWRPVAPLGIPHVSTEDLIYEGYFIPKGTVIMGNVWSMTRQGYTDPDAFIPERYLDGNGAINSDAHIIAFGFGRRVCPGQDLSETSIWLTIASVLSTFHITNAKDDNGHDIDIPTEFTDGIISLPPDFKCSITPRSLELLAHLT